MGPAPAAERIPDNVALWFSGPDCVCPQPGPQTLLRKFSPWRKGTANILGGNWPSSREFIWYVFISCPPRPRPRGRSTDPGRVSCPLVPSGEPENTDLTAASSNDKGKEEETQSPWGDGRRAEGGPHAGRAGRDPGRRDRRAVHGEPSSCLGRTSPGPAMGANGSVARGQAQRL